MTRPTDLCHQLQQDPRPEAWPDTLREHVGTCPHCRSFLATLRLAACASASGSCPALRPGCPNACASVC